MHPRWVTGGFLATHGEVQMSELETKKYVKEEPKPLLSLNQNGSNSSKSKKDDATEEQQEALWSRSLKFFEHMNAVNS